MNGGLTLRLWFTMPLAIVFCIGRVGQAVTHTWLGSVSGSMNTAANWAGGVPVSGNSNLTLIIPSAYNNAGTQNIANPLEVQKIQFAGSFSEISGSPVRFKNLGAAPSIEFTSNSSGLFVLNGVDFDDPTTLINTSNAAKELRFGGVLSGGDVTFDAQNATTRYSIQYNQANTLAGANFVKGYASLELVKPANVAAIGGSLTVDGPNAQLIFFFNGQLAAGTVLSAINGSKVDLKTSVQAVDDLRIESGATFFANGGASLVVNGQILSAAGFRRVGIRHRRNDRRLRRPV